MLFEIFKCLDVMLCNAIIAGVWLQDLSTTRIKENNVHSLVFALLQSQRKFVMTDDIL